MSSTHVKKTRNQCEGLILIKNKCVHGCICVCVYQQHNDLPMKTLLVESLSPPGRPSLEILAASPVAFATLVASAVILEAC
jgi:hypothetical protein